MLRIGSRTSPLALLQAKQAADCINSVNENKMQFEFIGKLTTGDINLSPFNQIRQENLFTKEIEEMLLSNEIDVAIHSMKDIPVSIHKDLEIVAVFCTDSYHDLLITNKRTSLHSLSQKAIIGTSSARRKAQLLNLRPDISIVELRGNIETRINKLRNSDMDGIIIAEAGINRLGINMHTEQERLHESISDGLWSMRISIDDMLPCAGQGVLAAQIRKGDEQTRKIVQPANHILTWRRVMTERKVLKLLQAECGDPVACLAIPEAGHISVICTILSRNGSVRYISRYTGNNDDESAIVCAHKLVGYKDIWKQN